MENRSREMKYLHGLVNYVPILKTALDSGNPHLPIRQLIHDTRLLIAPQEQHVIRCYNCGLTGSKVRLKQAPTLRRTTDEIIETHYYCTDCVK